MTKNISLEQKKFNKLIKALEGTWNCNNECSTCPFRKYDDVSNFVNDCGAIEIRKFALEIFKRVNPAMVKGLDQ